MIVAFACDHGGFSLREDVIRYLKESGHIIRDFSPQNLEPLDDFPDYAQLVCNNILSGNAERGVLICGTGIGMSIAANRFSGIRAVLSYSSDIAKISRSHNDANVICFGARTMTLEDVKMSLDIFFSESFIGDKYQRRNDKIDCAC
ncbi:ribose 5-phosphate isomerase B [Candidatus Gracilibacteria bacterium]|nr:ribose 5-phosphate isomerase B [Candidatus Gracilibacteria bacterium]